MREGNREGQDELERDSPPAEYQRRHEANDYVETGETLVTRQRNPVEET